MKSIKMQKSNIAYNLTTLRQLNKFSQEEVAERIGVSRQAVAKWETGQSVPDILNCDALAKLYDVELDDLIHYDQEQTGESIPPKGKHTVKARSRRIRTEGGRATPVLLPVWLMTTVKEGKTYTFAVNGQTGKLTCDVPADKAKSLLWGFGVFAGVFGVAALILALIKALGSGSLLICAAIAAILALAVVGALKGQLKQAAQQSTAHSYIRDGSFCLDVNADHFLYESTSKRKIEDNAQKE